jgi:hypothetical protein
MPDDKDKPGPALEPIVLSEEDATGKDAEGDELTDEEWYQKDGPEDLPEYSSLKKKRHVMRILSAILVVVLAVVVYTLYRKSIQPPVAEAPPLYTVDASASEPDQSQPPAAPAAGEAAPLSSPDDPGALPVEGASLAPVEETQEPQETLVAEAPEVPQEAQPGTPGYSFIPAPGEAIVEGEVVHLDDETLAEGVIDALEAAEGAEGGLPLAEEGAVLVPPEGAGALSAASLNPSRPGPRVIPQEPAPPAEVPNTEAPSAGDDQAAPPDEPLTDLSGGTLLDDDAQGPQGSAEIPLDPALDSESAEPPTVVAQATPETDTTVAPAAPVAPAVEAPATPATTPSVSGSGPPAPAATVSPQGHADPSSVRPTPGAPSVPAATVSPGEDPGLESLHDGESPPKVSERRDAPAAPTATVGPPSTPAAPQVTPGGAAPAPKGTVETPSSQAPRTGEEPISEVWAVSMYSSSSEADALAVLKRLQAFKPEGTLYLVNFTDKAGTLIHRVRLGFFQERDRADSVAKDLADKAKTPPDHWSSNPTVSEVDRVGAPVVGSQK